MSFKLEVTTNNGIEWSTNALRFATPEEAKGYGNNLFMRWTSVTDTRVAPSEDPVNYRWDSANQRLEEAAASPVQPIEANRIRKDTVLRLRDGTSAIMKDNKPGIRRVLEVNGEMGSTYIWDIHAACIDGVWRPVAMSQAQQRLQAKIAKDIRI